MADSLVLKYLHGLNHQTNIEKPGGPSASSERTEWSKVKIGAVFCLGSSVAFVKFLFVREVYILFS